MRILLVEQNPLAAAEFVQRMKGTVVEVAVDGLEAADFLKSYDFDAVLLQLPLLDMTPAKLIRSLRLDKVTAPILVLTDTEHTMAHLMIEALDAGADMHLPGASSDLYLKACIRACVRRAHNIPNPTVQIGEITVDLSHRAALFRDQRLPLTGKEYEMLELLAMRRGSTITKEMFLNHLYQERDEPELKIIDVFICKLRKKLREATGSDYVETIWGRGYTLREPAAAAA
jgi:two-component system cell cycle response regulator CtrA